MTATNHVITGAVIGSVVVNPLVALPVAFIAHFALDALPHYGKSAHTDKKFLYMLSVDAGFASAVLVTITILQPQYWLVIVLCGIVCASPDLMWFPRWLVELSGKTPKPMGLIRRFHARIQWAEREAWWGILSEATWFLLMFAALSRALQI